MSKQISSNHISQHASNRMHERSINDWQIEQVLTYGRKAHNRKAIIYAVGRKEVKANGRFLETCEGIHVLCSPDNGTIITTYRNNDLRGLRR